MGLRQLYFLLGGLLNRLVYLDTGLAVILGFIGVKLILEALHGQGVSWAPEIGIVPSLAVIVLVLGITTWLSLRKVRRTRPRPSTCPRRRPPPRTPVRDVGRHGLDAIEERANDAAARRAAEGSRPRDAGTPRRTPHRRHPRRPPRRRTSSPRP